MTETEELLSVFDWIVSKILKYKKQQPLEWLNKELELHQTDNTYIGVFSRNYAFSFRMEYNYDWRLILFMNDLIRVAVIKINNFGDIWDGKQSVLEDCYQSNDYRRKIIDILIDMDILTSKLTFNHKGYENDKNTVLL